MFDNIKKIQELKRIQDALTQERETVQKKGISATMNGAAEVISITLNPALDQQETEVALVQCINEATKNIQKRMAAVMMSSGIGGF